MLTQCRLGPKSRRAARQRTNLRSDTTRLPNGRPLAALDALGLQDVSLLSTAPLVNVSFHVSARKWSVIRQAIVRTGCIDTSQKSVLV